MRLMTKKAPIALALDAPDLTVMKDWIEKTSPYLECMKVGLEVFLRDSRRATLAVRQLAPEAKLFLDLKLHDIPQTVENAAKSLKDIAPEYLTVHASGGPEMINRAAKVLPNTKIVAVTILTSLEVSDLAPFGVTDVLAVVTKLAKQSVDAGAQAIVSSPLEVSAIRAAVGSDVTLITPGVRFEKSDATDQKRVMTPEEAIKAGSDLLVVGRPITAKGDVGKNAQEIAHKVNQIL